MRPSPRHAFLEKAKRLVVYFHTSNIEKYLQAKFVFEEYGLALHHFRSHSEPYAENYNLSKDQLLANAIDEVKTSVGRTSLFFVEDTSLRIEALSSAESDFPGLAVKEWFAATSFARLHGQLPVEHDGRLATVKSDIALHVPGLADPVLFHGETTGHISRSMPEFEENQHYPWLTPRTFNGWFVPRGASRRLGEMSLDESWEHDFRVQSLTLLLARLEEYAAMLNAPRECFAIPASRPTPSFSQRTLFETPGRAFVVLGATCGGKTTFGQILQKAVPGMRVIEASNVVRSFRRRADERLSPLEFVKRLTREEGNDVVAQKIMSMYRLGIADDFVITGFRYIEEVEVVRECCPHATVILVEATARTRYARHLRRGRSPVASYKEFLASDGEQWDLGLLAVAGDFAEIRIDNDGTLEEYEHHVLTVLRTSVDRDTFGIVATANVGAQRELSVHRLFRCLDVLDVNGDAMTCDNIARETAASAVMVRTPSIAEESSRYTGKRIPPNNVNKILKSVPALAKRTEVSEGAADRLRYAITGSGRAYVRLMRAYAEGSSASKRFRG